MIRHRCRNCGHPDTVTRTITDKLGLWALAITLAVVLAAAFGPVYADECSMGQEPKCTRWEHACKLEWDRYYSGTDKFLRCKDGLRNADSRLLPAPGHSVGGKWSAMMWALIGALALLPLVVFSIRALTDTADDPTNYEARFKLHEARNYHKWF